MAVPMTADQANAVYDVLVGICGASDAKTRTDPYVGPRADFEYHQTAGATDEYRFQGALGFGGKFWNCNGRWYVTCYREDETAQRRAMIEATNAALAALRERTYA